MPYESQPRLLGGRFASGAKALRRLRSAPKLNIGRRKNAPSLMLRAQYHFRHSEGGLLAWDVRRLVALSQGLPVLEVPVADIQELDEPHWYSHGTGTPTCRSISEHCSLIQAADLSHPIILDASGRVMDGMHRVCKALVLGASGIKAVQFARTPEPDFIGQEPDSLPYE